MKTRNENSDEFSDFLSLLDVNPRNWFLGVMLPLLAGGFGLYALIIQKVAFSLGGARYRTIWVPLLPYEAMTLGAGLVIGALLLPLACYGESHEFMRRNRAYLAALGILVPLLSFFAVVFLFLIRQFR